MNQQRVRRFFSAKEMRDKKEKERLRILKQKEEGLLNEVNAKELLDALEKKDEDFFDSNVITPGTEFMRKVSLTLRYYIAKKQREDPAWANIAVILSDANVPGEGEHKIMAFIRKQRSCEGYDPNTKHVIHGLDADLMMLGLASHEPHFYILREDVPRTGCPICGGRHNMDQCEAKKRREQPWRDTYELQRNFVLVQISVLREYLERDMKPVDLDGIEWNSERMVDDFVLICFFVGNDFLPHSATLDIRDNDIPRLFLFWKMTIRQTGGYLTKNGNIDWKRMSVFVSKIADQEEATFERRKSRALMKMRGSLKKLASNINHSSINFIPSSTGGLGSPPDKKKEKNVTGKRKREENEGEKQLGEPEKKKPKKKLSFLDLILKTFDKNHKTKEEKSSKKSKREERTNDSNKRQKIRSASLGGKDVRLGEDGWRERYYKAKFGVTMDDAKFFHTYFLHLNNLFNNFLTIFQH